mgnify:FL=1
MLREQYQMVKSSRNLLFKFLRTVYPIDFINENSHFGKGSIRNLLVHIADTYASWIGEKALKKDVLFETYVSFQNIDNCIVYFERIDGYVESFINQYESNLYKEIEILRNEQILMISPIKLFTHVITHEFHHKGQIMSLCRHLNYTPIDADIIQ